MSWLAAGALGLVLLMAGIAVHLVRRSGYRDGLAKAAEILLASWAREPKDAPAVLASGQMGEALRKILSLLGRPGKAPGPVLSAPETSPCSPCGRGEHRACHGGYLDAGGKAACGCACPQDFA